MKSGYKVVYVEMDQNGNVVSIAQDLMAHQPPNANWSENFSPVDVDFDASGRLVVTSDGSGAGSKIVRIASTHSTRSCYTPTCFSGTMNVALEDGSVVTLKDVQA